MNIKKQWLIFKTRIAWKIAYKLQCMGIIPPDPVEERLYHEAMIPFNGHRR